MISILIPIISMGGIGAVLATILVVADNRLKIEEDPRVEEVHEVLPGANCGACGLPGCHQFAENVVKGAVNADGCSAGGPDVAALIAKILQTDVKIKLAVKASLRCRGGKEQCGQRSKYTGLNDCRAASLFGNGAKDCIYGCLGYGTCMESCPFNAIVIKENGLPEIIDEKCTGCGICVFSCPRDLIQLVSEETKIIVACASPEKGKSVKQICSKGCIGCELCGRECPLSAISFLKNLPIIDNKKCDGCGICVEKCPTNSLIPAVVKERQGPSQEAGVKS